MSEPFIAEIRIFAGNFAPRGWAFCNGQLLPIAQNTALFSLVGTIYGGNGETDFGLPDLKGRAPMHQGTGPGLSRKRIGEKGGASDVTLAAIQLPSHAHTLQGSGQDATATDPSGNLPAVSREDTYTSASVTAPLLDGAIGSTGGGQSHNNMQPFLAMYFIIALVGTYPSES